MKPFTASDEATKRAVWDVLVEECGARPSQWDQFSSLWPECTEFRFMGVLGFGGKVYDDLGAPWVGCYREDETPERRAVIERTNERLRAAVTTPAVP